MAERRVKQPAGSRLALPAALVLGVLNALRVPPLWSATPHGAVGALLLLAPVAVNYRAFRDERAVSRDLPIPDAARA